VQRARQLPQAVRGKHGTVQVFGKQHVGQTGGKRRAPMAQQAATTLHVARQVGNH
jgi:hypothetical protein